MSAPNPIHREPKYSCLSDERPVCTIGGHVIGDEEWVYTINAIGGYGLDEILCCETCIRKPENTVARQRMIDAGAKELARTD